MLNIFDKQIMCINSLMLLLVIHAHTLYSKVIPWQIPSKWLSLIILPAQFLWTHPDLAKFTIKLLSVRALACLSTNPYHVKAFVVKAFNIKIYLPFRFNKTTSHGDSNNTNQRVKQRTEQQQNFSALRQKDEE